MIAARRLQCSFADGFIAGEVTDLWEPWMRHADEALNDDQLLEIIQEELNKRMKRWVGLGVVADNMINTTESPTATGRDDSPGAAGDEADAGTSARRQYAGEQQTPERI